ASRVTSAWKSTVKWTLKQRKNRLRRTPVPTTETKRRIDWLFDNDQYNLANSERPDCHKDGTTYTAVYGRTFPNLPAPTITTGIGTPGQGRFIHPLRRRLVTPKEAARIQGFPDGYGFVGKNNPAKRKDLAKWIGDAVPAPMGYEMARRALIAIGMTSDDHGLP
ncbi:MAG: DNA cytosine methyltransferase, partial [Sulfitobacter sp.]